VLVEQLIHNLGRHIDRLSVRCDVGSYMRIAYDRSDIESLPLLWLLTWTWQLRL
jgi:hypothetical protein